MTIRNALILAAAIFGLSLTVNYLNNAGHIGDETARRAVQVAAGLVVVYFANLAPKTLEPLSRRRDPGYVQALQRFSGWTLVLGGLGYSLAWLFVPIEHARTTSMVLLGAALLLVVARCAWAYLGGGASRQPPAGEI